MLQPQWKYTKAKIFYEILKRLYFIIIFAYLPLLMVLTLISDLKAGGGFFDLGYWLPLLLFLWLTVPFYGFFISSGLSINGLFTLKTKNFDAPKAKLAYILSLVLAIVMSLWNILTLMDLTSFSQLAYLLSPIVAMAELIFLLVLQRKLAKKVPENEFSDHVLTHKISIIKNTTTVFVITLSILAVLFIPYETIRYADGGTVMTNALAYSVVEWNRGKNADDIVTTNKEDLQYANEEQHTRFYFFPHNFKSYSELWEMKH